MADIRSGGSLRVDGLVKDYPLAKGWHRAVDGVDFEVQEGAFYSLLGPSGCGKTTTLRCVAGLERPDAGEIRIGDDLVAGPNLFQPPERRTLGMVFQNYAIWPHMTVFENAAFPLRVARRAPGRAEVARRVEEVLELVQLAGLAGRSATQLSGGQQQRLALARALIRQPRLLLLDEPLSNLDAKLRDRMRGEIRSLQRRLGITTVYVTHDQVEALSMSDRIAVMDGGKIVQEGTPREIYGLPATRFVATFVGTANLLPGIATEPSAGGHTRVRVGSAVLHARCPTGLAPGDEVTVSIRPEAVEARTEPAQGENVLAGSVEEVQFVGEALDCRIAIDTLNLVARLGPKSNLRPGDSVSVRLPVEDLVVISDTHGIAAGSEAAIPPRDVADPRTPLQG
jgi:iron(III) transport system ATP-binding protein